MKMDFHFHNVLLFLQMVATIYLPRSLSQLCSHIFRDCTDVKASGFANSGVYHVTPTGRNTGYDVYCEMTEDNGEWLLFQRRFNGTVDFYRGWDDYVKGFGNASGEYWLGNQPLKTILAQGYYELRVDLEDWEGTQIFAQYNVFDIGNFAEDYRLSVGVYSGNAEDSMSFHHGALFSTFDHENSPANCSSKYTGAWWYQHCHVSNLNGVYHNSSAAGNGEGLQWIKWKGSYYSLKTTEMKIRRG